MFDRNAKPIEWLRKALTLFLNRMSEIQNAASNQKVCILEQSLKIKKQNFVYYFLWSLHLCQFNFEISNF